MADNQTTTLPELTTVRSKRDLESTPAGCIGTIVHVYPSGAYEVEFLVGDTIEDHYHTVETCEAQDIEVCNEQ